MLNNHTINRDPSPSNADKFKFLDDLWAIVNEEHEKLDEGERSTDVAIAIARSACIAFLFKTEDR